MVQYERELLVEGDPGEVFAYLADFSNTAEWDPGIVEARRLTEPPTAVGSRFEVVALFRGNRQQFVYEVTELDEGRRIGLRGEGGKAVSEDVLTVTGGPDGTRVGYRADLRLKGPYRIAEPFLGRTFTRMGDDALDGLAARLSAR